MHRSCPRTRLPDDDLAAPIDGFMVEQAPGAQYLATGLYPAARTDLPIGGDLAINCLVLVRIGR